VFCRVVGVGVVLGPGNEGLSTEVVDGLYGGDVNPRRFGRVEREREELTRGAGKVELKSWGEESRGS
jgi:hypothetical protein